MAYKALYRTYRPQKFEEVYGQEVIIKTLKNTIKQNKISHAYLFSGPRGIGKTTIARIFAKALNCKNVIDGEPCCECDSCLSVSEGSHPDVIEIDAASNNGVDEIREIRDKVKFLPVGSKYKIYIIDEVHMLTTGAFNALLKTLEEPPKHAIFILATTELYKIPSTIISRCQCFEFKGLSNGELVDNLTKVIANENIEADDEALKAIAEASNGGARDALSYLDQAISYCDGKITLDDVNLITGNLDEEKVIDIALFLEHKNVVGAMQIVNEFLDSGKDAIRIVNSLLELYRDVLLYKNIENESLKTKRIFSKELFIKLSEVLTNEHVFYYVDILSDVASKMKYTSTPNIYLEISLIKITNVTSDQIKLSEKVKELEEKLSNAPVSSGSSTSVVDNEKVVLLENKLNRVINQLNQLDLPSVISRIEKLESLFTESKKDNQSSGDLSQIEEELLILKTNVNSLQNQVDQPHDILSSDDVVEEVMTEVGKKLNELDMKIERISGSINTEALHLLDEKIEELNAIKKSVFEHKYTRDEDYEINEIKDKIINIENKLHKYIAVVTSTEPVPIKKSKSKAAETLGVYSEGIFSLEDISSNKVNIEFDDLQKEDVIAEEKENKLQPSVETIFEEPNEKEEVSDATNVESETADEMFEDLVNQMSTDKEEIVKAEKKVTKENVETVINKTNDPTRDEINLFNFLSGQHNEEVTSVEKSDGVLITKPNSQLYKRNASVTQDTNIDNLEDAFANEREELNKDLLEVKPVSHEEYTADEYSRYDVRVVERILNDSRTETARSDKARVLKIWNVMNRDLDPELLHIANMLQQGNVVAVGNKEIIIVYPTSAMCNQVMRMKFKKESLKLLYNVLGDTYNYMALPENVWADKRIEYRSLYCAGTKNIKLTPINDPTLSVVSDDQEYFDESQKAIKKVKEMFGSDLVKVE